MIDAGSGIFNLKTLTPRLTSNFVQDDCVHADIGRVYFTGGKRAGLGKMLGARILRGAWRTHVSHLKALSCEMTEMG